MPEVESGQNRVTFKLVYYGPAQGGKTTNLMQLHDLLAPEMKGELMTFETKNDRTLFFDLLPLGFRLASGLMLRFRLFTVPGQVAHDGTRKAVLSRADGVVFVADSQLTQSSNNGESFENLVQNIARVGLDIEKLPLVVQFNKRDLPDILSEDEIMRRYADAPWPLHLSSAINGQGVRETYVALLRQVWRRYAPELQLADEYGMNEDSFLAAALGA